MCYPPIPRIFLFAVTLVFLFLVFMLLTHCHCPRHCPLTMTTKTNLSVSVRAVGHENRTWIQKSAPQSLSDLGGGIYSVFIHFLPVAARETHMQE